VFVGVSTGIKGNNIPKQTMTPLAGAVAE
jgi:hypothetical protein